MRAPVGWLREFVDFDFTPEELAHKLTMVGLEVETVEPFQPPFSGVRVARIIDSQTIPENPSLRLCRVDAGDRAPARVVCGAPNAASGLLAAWAPPGSRLPGGREIKTESIHGHDSQGMLCSPLELGLSPDASRLLAVGNHVRPGTDLAEALDLADHVLSIELNPNRPDCLGIFGIAREISVITGGRLRPPSFRLSEPGPKVGDRSDVRIEAPDMCPRYVLRLIAGCTVGPSPVNLTRRLLACGLRPINNLVDVTNYVMMELGQPLHAFDLDLLEEKRIVVRRANAGETMDTLDGVRRKLSADLLVIADARRPVAVAGVMGGAASGITDRTRDVLLESACFDPGAIRRAARFLGLSTDSSHRFERGVDVELAPKASDRAAALIARLSGGTTAAGRIDAYPRKLKPASVRYRPARASAVLGCQIPWSQQRRILRRLQFGVGPLRAGAAEVAVPGFRVDMNREIDLIEEVGRHYGYQLIPARLFAGINIPRQRTENEIMRARLAEIMVGLGFTQVLTTSFVDRAGWALFNRDSRNDRGVVLRNPISAEQACLRPSLVPTMIAVVARNLNAGLENVRVFELGRVFEPRDQDRPLEIETLTALLAGVAWRPSWADPGRPADIFTVKGVAETVLDALRIAPVRFAEEQSPPHPWAGPYLAVSSDHGPLGAVGCLSPEWLERMDVREPAFFVELRLDALSRSAAAGIRFRPFSRFPAAKRDLALIVPESVPEREVAALIRQAGGTALESARLFDFYRGPQIPAGSKSLAYSLSFRHPERTLTDEEIDSVLAGLLARLKADFGISLRS